MIFLMSYFLSKFFVEILFNNNATIEFPIVFTVVHDQHLSSITVQII